jgi:hypothetical protein
MMRRYAQAVRQVVSRMIITIAKTACSDAAIVNDPIVPLRSWTDCGIA